MRSLSLSISGVSLQSGGTSVLQGGGTTRRSRGLTSGLRARLGGLAALERFDHLHGAAGVEIFVEIVADPDHRRIDAGAEAFDLGQREFAVGGGFADADAQFLLAGVDDVVRAAQLA